MSLYDFDVLIQELTHDMTHFFNMVLGIHEWCPV